MKMGIQSGGRWLSETRSLGELTSPRPKDFAAAGSS